MGLWRPNLSELVAPFTKVRSWDISLEHFKKGIDNAHVDVYLSPSLCDGVRETVRKLILKDIRRQGRSANEDSIDEEGLKSFRNSYLGIFESISEQTGTPHSTDRLALLQLSLLKYLIQIVAQERFSLQSAFKVAVNQVETRESGRDLKMHERLITLTRDEHRVNRRVLHVLFRLVKKLESTRLEKVRESLVGETWPIPKRAFFNPVLLVPNPDDSKELARVYPIARLGETGDMDWLYHTNQCVSTVFQYYLPPWTRLPSYASPTDASAGSKARERLDQGQLPGFLGTEILLNRFVPAEEYRFGRCSWLDAPENLRLFLAAGRGFAESHSAFAESGFVDLHDSDLLYAGETVSEPAVYNSFAELPKGQSRYWNQDGWQDFQSAISDELYRCLDLQGLSRRIILLYWLRAVGNKLTRPVPLSLVVDFVEGRLPRRRLAQRLDVLNLALDPATVARVLEHTATRLKQLKPTERARYLRVYLADFLVFRRDLKLAYKTYEAMDWIRLIDDPQQVQLSRANGSLYEFAGSREERPRSERPIRAHAVLKADLRGSTLITEGLREKGLNPASHFGLNFFGPVNKLLPDFGAEKLFVEGDAVIIGFFERAAEPAAMTVSRACGLARSMLQVVSLQNTINRKHGLPNLELGLGISYSDQEPNFLYDEGHRIMISGAINQADRLSSCSSELRSSGFRPGHEGFRVEVVKDSSVGFSAVRGDDFLSYNVNGIKLEKAAFFKLQKETNLSQVRLPEFDTVSGLFFTGSFPDRSGREHWLVLRYAPIREWDGRSLGPITRDRGHFFEVIADEALITRVRKLAVSPEALPLRGRT